ncbi:MAG: DUF115 domain-containing protein [Candidatus Omnitrophica bacterium]|nr:DUF115 domain-containing protein [Candidatus Omnitrophota bacterium]MBD3269243.1 DUF115 domain-containing protein [Candidatus Omnitrophota bacterium]
MDNVIYEKNLKALKENRPHLYERLEKTQSGPSLEVFASKSGVPTLKVDNILFHSAYDPLREVDYLTEDFSPEITDVLIVLGFGLGYHIKKVWSNPYFKGKMLIVEKNPAIFKIALKNTDFINLINDPSVFFVIEEDHDLALSLIEKSGFLKINTVGVNMLLHPPSSNLFTSYYLEISRGLRGLLSFYRSSFDTMRWYQNIWQENTLNNLLDIANRPGIEDFKDLFKGIPAIIVSAGPSLDNDLEILKSVKGKIPIFSVGTALGALVNSGITPDFTVVVDAGPKVLKQFENISIPHDTVLCSGDFVRSEIIEKFKPKVFFFSCPSNPFSALFPSTQKKGKVFSGGSVAHAAVDVASVMGFNPIIMVGQDLSYAENKTHASQTMYGDETVNCSGEEEFKKRGFIWLKGNYEEKVLSTRSFYVFLAGMERYIKDHPQKRFINSTCGGAFIRGTELMKLDEAVARYSKGYSFEDVGKKIEDIFKSFIPDLEGFCDNLCQARSRFETIIDDLENGYTKALELRKLLTSSSLKNRREVHEIALNLDEISKRLNDNPFVNLLQYGEGYYRYLTLDMELKFSKVRLEAQKKLCESAHEVYKGFLDSARLINEEIDKLLSRIQAVKSNE